MTEKPYIAGALIGAAVGSAIGYLYFTDAGRRQRDAIGEVLDNLQLDVKELRTFWTRLHLAIDEYQTAVADAFEGGRRKSVYINGPRDVA